MDPKLVAIIEDYARANGLNLPPHQIVSDMVASGPSGVEQLLSLLGVSVNSGDPADNLQAQTGQTPATNPALWKTLPMTACGQLVQFCQGNSLPEAKACLAAGQAGNESVCLGQIGNGFQGDNLNPDGSVSAPGLSQCLSDCLATTIARKPIAPCKP